MTDSARTDDSSLLSIAAAIARGEPVDWSTLHADGDP
jgi:hypothetical protein